MNLFRILFILYNIIKGVRNLLRLKKVIDDTWIKDLKNWRIEKLKNWSNQRQSN